MLAQFVILSFATYIIWETVLSFLPVPYYASPFCVAAIACAWGIPLDIPAIIIAAAVGGVAILHSLANTAGEEPVITKIKLPKRKPKPRRERGHQGERGHRIRNL